MKKTVSVIIFVLFISQNTLNSQNLNLPVNIQEKNQWCWAGCTKSILSLYGISRSQCEIAEYTRSTSNCTNYGTANCCTNSNVGCNQPNYLWGCLGSIQSILSNYANIQTINLTSSLTLSQIGTEISLNRPFVVRWGWNSGGGHFVVGYGVNGNNINYMDPWFNEGAHIATHAWLVNDGVHSWTHTSKMNISPLCQRYDTINKVSCDSFVFRSKTYKLSGSYRDTFKSGCDSITLINLTINKSKRTVVYDTSCTTKMWNGMECKNSGKYTKAYLAANGCDSIVELNLIINRVKIYTIINGCNSVIYKNNTYTNSTIFVDTIFNSTGCDSILETHIGVGENKQLNFQINSCKSYLWVGEWYHQSGQFSKVFKTNYNCDSAVTIDLNITRVQRYINVTACDSVSINGKSISSTGLYIDTVKSTCDTVYTTNATINPSYIIQQNQNACKSYTWLQTTYNLSGLYTKKMKTKNNCDSILSLNLRIDTINKKISVTNNNLTSQELKANTYQWLKCPLFTSMNGEKSKQFTPNISGNYAVRITKGACVDTTTCVNFNKSSINEIEFSDLEIFPNPSSSYLNIFTKNSQIKPVHYKVFDIYNKLFISNRCENIQRLDIQGLSNGFYFIEIEDQNGKLYMFKFEKTSF